MALEFCGRFGPLIPSQTWKRGGYQPKWNNRWSSVTLTCFSSSSSTAHMDSNCVECAAGASRHPASFTPNNYRETVFMTLLHHNWAVWSRALSCNPLSLPLNSFPRLEPAQGHPNTASKWEMLPQRKPFNNHQCLFGHVLVLKSLCLFFSICIWDISRSSRYCFWDSLRTLLQRTANQDDTCITAMILRTV